MWFSLLSSGLFSLLLTDGALCIIQGTNVNKKIVDVVGLHSRFLPCYNFAELGSVAGPVIQANVRLIFEDDLKSGGLLYFTTKGTSVRTEFADSMVTLGDG